MITEVRMTNVRGVTKKVTLGPKTVLTGPNGAGKTTVAAAIELALLGYIPGYDKKGVFANSSDPKLMAAGVTIDGHVVDRVWKQGKSLSESLTIDGVTAGRGAADAMLAMALGREPRVFDVKAFFASTATEQRRICLELVMPAAEMKALMDEEAREREAKNLCAARRRDAQSVVDRLVESRAAMEAPTGNIVALREEEATLRTRYDETVKANATAIENDRLRAELRVASDAEMAEAEANLTKSAEMLKDAEENLKKAESSWEAIVAQEPQPSEPSDEAKKLEALLMTLRGSLADVEGRGEPELEASRFGTLTTAGKTRMEDIRETVRNLKEHLSGDNTGLALAVETLHLINSIIPDERTLRLFSADIEGWRKEVASLKQQIQQKTLDLLACTSAEGQAYSNAWNAWEAKRLEAADGVNQWKKAVVSWSKTVTKLQAGLDGMKAAAAKLATVGAGVDPNEAKIIEGMERRLEELRQKIDALAEFETIDREIEKARLKVTSAEDEETAAKVKLEAVIAKQQSVVQSASDMLEVRSMAVLSEGTLKMIDDGKNIDIVWCRDGRPPVHRHTLSGGEQAIFDPAMGYALAPSGLVIMEAAEVDNWPGRSRMTALLEHLAAAPCDLLVMTCHKPEAAPAPWSLVVVD